MNAQEVEGREQENKSAVRLTEGVKGSRSDSVDEIGDNSDNLTQMSLMYRTQNSNIPLDGNRLYQWIKHVLF
jgi:hypothetical protein